MTGLFITFEGGEGAGKTTQINRLAQSLTQMGHRVVTTREPGGTPESEKIRALLVQSESGNWTPMSETLLFFAARSLLVDKVIAPALAEGKIVICDRFTDSTRAYQGYGHDMDMQTIESLKTTVLGDLEPDLTFILDIDSEQGILRSERRLAAEALSVKQKEDRFEKMQSDFHTRLRQGFLEIAKADPDRCRIIDATQSIDDVSKDILKETQSRLT